MQTGKAATVTNREVFQRLCPEWHTDETVSVTVSRREDTAETAREFCLELLQQAAGATLCETVGIWQGQVEYGGKFSLVGKAWPDALAIADAALDSGCVAIQIEIQDSAGFRCFEYRGKD